MIAYKNTCGGYRKATVASTAEPLFSRKTYTCRQNTYQNTLNLNIQRIFMQNISFIVGVRLRFMNRVIFIHTHTIFYCVCCVCSLGSGPFNGNDGGKREWWQPDQTMSCHGIFSCLHVFLLLFCFLFDIITINRFLLWLYIHFNFSLIHSFIHLHPSTHT